MDPEQTFLRVHARLSGMLSQLLTPRIRLTLEYIYLTVAVALFCLLVVMHTNFVQQPGCSSELARIEFTEAQLVQIKIVNGGLWARKADDQNMMDIQKLGTHTESSLTPEVGNAEFFFHIDPRIEDDSSHTPSLVVQSHAEKGKGISLLKDRELRWKQAAMMYHDRCVVLAEQIEQLRVKHKELARVDEIVAELKGTKEYIEELKKMVHEKSGIISNCRIFFRDLGCLVNAPDHSRAYPIAREISLMNDDVRKSIDDIIRRARISDEEYKFHCSRNKKLSIMYTAEKRLREDLIRVHN